MKRLFLLGLVAITFGACTLSPWAYTSGEPVVTTTE
jgi:hypothetical protein